MKFQCKTCDYWWQWDKDEPYGECRRYPPRKPRDEDDNLWNILTNHNEGCGEHHSHHAKRR